MLADRCGGSTWHCRLMRYPRVFDVDRLEFSLGQWRWPFAEQRRDEIAAHFAILRSKKPDLWNGRVLMIDKSSFDAAAGTLRGNFFETGFADLVAWRDWGYPDHDAINGFAMGAIRSADGAYLLGVMGEATANAGHIYFPSGTPDPSDIVGDKVDLAGSVAREVEEETGLRLDDFEPQVGWTAVETGPSLALMRHLQARENAETLRARIVANLARQENPELSDIRIVRTRADFHPDMPGFMTAFLDRALAR
jgi:8-oxo-dGTP pyrophosphatase MutT (NUDIX family)